MAGNIVKIKEGSYRLRYKEQSKNIKAKNDSAAERLLAKFITEVDEGKFVAEKYTFKSFAEKWLKEYAEINLAPKNTFNHRKLLENRIYKEIGHLKLEKVTPLILTEFYNKLRQSGERQDKRPGTLSERTIKLHHKTISAVYETAAMWRVFHYANPCKGVKFPKEKKKPAKFYDAKQIKAMLKALEQEEIEYRTAVTLAIDSGVRIGELSGFLWEDIDTEKKLITIDKASQYIPGKGTFEKDPKTENSYRTITLPDSTVTLIEEYKGHQQSRGFLCADNNPLFVKYNGQAKYAYWLSAWFPAFLKRHGLPPLNFHGTRHSSASYLLNAGMNINAVADRLGDTPATILNTYAHALKNSDKQAAETLNKLHKA